MQMSNEEIQKFQNKLINQFHQAQIGLLFSGFTHNLRSPMAAITLKTSMLHDEIEELLNEDVSDPMVLYEYLEESLKLCDVVLERSEDLMSIITEFMNYHQTNIIDDTSVVDLNSVLNTDIPMLNADLDIKHHVSLTNKVGTEPIWVKAKASEISQIFLVLITNARDAILTCENKLLTIESGIEEEKGSAWFEVHDSGVGIPEKFVNQLGESIISSKSDDRGVRYGGSGSGLGFYLINIILQRINGRFEISTNPGDTRIRIYIPATSPPSTETEE